MDISKSFFKLWNTFIKAFLHFRVGKYLKKIGKLFLHLKDGEAKVF